jgi:ABC-type phosphate transport system substrate-binding protein
MPIANGYAQFYQCTQNMPLGCSKPKATLESLPGAKFCLECGFPTPLAAQVEIRGNLGTYRIAELLRSQGTGRLYRGTQIGKNHTVLIKEYLLPNRCFNTIETQQRRTAFVQIIQPSLNHQKAREFRMVCPSEVIADPASDRIYLIFPSPVMAAPTLTQVIRETGAFSAKRIRLVLEQVLQTLHFLHSQTPETVHGNLGLDSLFMSRHDYVYTGDLASWEQHFSPMPMKKSSPARDLIDLGWVAFSLWTGEAIPPDADAMPNPREAQYWPQEDPPLKDFLHRLLGLDTPFESAAEARQTLLKLPQPQRLTGFQVEFSPESEAKPKSHRYWLLGLLALPILGGLLWLLLPRSIASSAAETTKFKQLLPSFAHVNGIEPGQYPYTGEKLGTWNTILHKQPIDDRKMRELLTRPKLDIAATFTYRGYTPQKSPLEEVLHSNGKANFAIASLTTQLPEGLVQETVAYDGLLVYIPAYKSQNLPDALQGKISLTQLKQIFTGQLTNWRKLGSNFPDLTIKPYRPLESEALQLFEQKVLNNDPRLVARFRKIPQRTTLNTLRAIEAGDQQVHKTEAGTLSFALLTQTWDQCKVYPLALTQGNEPVQPMQRETTDGTLKSISPSDNLCLGKKPLPDISAFYTARYPLSMPVVVAYPLDNNLPGHRSGPLFAKFLKTQDGQYLLQQAGVVPLQTIPKNHPLSSSISDHQG